MAKKKIDYQEDARIISTHVLKIDYKNQPVGKNGRLKTVFYCPTYECPDGRMCVIYDRTTIDVGDEIRTTGRFNGDVFLAWSIQIIKKGKNNG